ncbi:hypothetical protein V8G54_030103 [Vigna mungo]|uniref:Uncharacterized protein n=1 Tax=Vigna mungo TaxID=3915 RepID=A0AAQ3MV04_VIGMU
MVYIVMIMLCFKMGDLVFSIWLPSDYHMCQAASSRFLPMLLHIDIPFVFPAVPLFGAGKLPRHHLTMHLTPIYPIFSNIETHQSGILIIESVCMIIRLEFCTNSQNSICAVYTF